MKAQCSVSCRVDEMGNPPIYNSVLDACPVCLPVTRRTSDDLIEPLTIPCPKLFQDIN